MSQKNTFSIVIELEDSVTTETIQTPENIEKIMSIARNAHVYNWSVGQETIEIDQVNEISDKSAAGFGNIINITKG